MVLFEPTETVAAGLIVSIIVSLTVVHGEDCPVLLKIRFTEPAAMSAALGVYTAVGLLLLLKEPVPVVVQVPPVAPPLNVAAMVAVLFEQMGKSGPAFTTAAGFTVTVAEPEAAWVQAGAAVYPTLTRLNVELLLRMAVGKVKLVSAVPLPATLNVWLLPPLIL
jgi:hypothetical protein